MLAPEPLVGFTVEQRTIRDHIPARQNQLDDRPVALAARVATGADRAQLPTVGLGHHAQPVQQRPPQRRPRDARGQIIGPGDRDLGSLTLGTGDQVSGIEQHSSRVLHQTGAFLFGDLGSSTPRMIPKRKAFVAYRTPVPPGHCTIRV